MTSQPHEPEAVESDDLTYYRTRAAQLADIVTGVRAVLGVVDDQPDWRARCDAAAAAIRQLLDIPGRRPGAWEAAPVSKLDHDLRAILDELEGGGAR